jgi:hypothetical protein
MPAAAPAAPRAGCTGPARWAPRVGVPRPPAAGSPPASPAAVGTSRPTALPGAVATAPASPPVTLRRSSRPHLGCRPSASHGRGPRGGAPAPRPVPSGPPPHPERLVPRRQPRLHPSAPRRAARAAVQGRGLGPTAGAPSCPPFGPSARARGPPIPAADCGLPIGSDASARRSPRLLRARAPPAALPGSDTDRSGRRRRMYQAHPRRGGRTAWSRAHSSRVVPPLLSGSWASPRTCGLGCLQTSPRDDALALLLAFGAANTGHGDFHPVSSGPCLAHTLGIRRGCKPSPACFS